MISTSYKTELFYFEKAIPLLTVRADQFPDGIQSAHHKLHQIIPRDKPRKHFGVGIQDISNQELTYMAGVEQLAPEEPDLFELDTFRVEKGEYLFIYLPGFKKDPTSFSRAFEQLFEDPRTIDSGYGLEYYPNTEDVHCLVPVKD